ncbi:MAG: cytochrome P450 [Kineosporiaceae bacterium]|nr:cytochrome P450 [Aeromicrobium sp.]
MNLAPAATIHDGVPPGPKYPPLIMTWLFLRHRTKFMRKFHQKYGETFSLRILPGPRRIVIFSRPEDIKEIFAGDPSQFHAGEGNSILKPVMGEHSVLLTDDGEHMRARKLLMPAFNGASLRGYQSLVESIAKSEVDNWNDRQTLVSLDRMNVVTLEVILQVVFGVTDESRLDRMRPLVNRMVNIDARMLLAWSFPKLFALPPWKSYFVNQQNVDKLLYAEIAERREAKAASVDGQDGRDDVLSRLLRVGADEGELPLTDAELRDQLVTLLLAGHETTASALSWTLHELGRNRDVMREALKAADEGDDAFLEACLKESMRLHPVIDFVARTLKSPQVVGGWSLSRGDTVAPSILLSHAREENFPGASIFRPRRFLDGHAAPNTWIPFGGGVRRCIGAGFSLMEGTTVLAEVLRRYDVVADEPSPNKLRNITNVPEDKAPLRLTSRHL